MLHLEGGTFLATQYMRHASAPLYTPEPDVIHELVGHAALLLDPAFAEVNRAFGRATRRALERGASEHRIEQLIRAYWYTLEFGVAGGARRLEVYGAGLLSSFGELGRFESEADLRPFDLDQMAARPFDPTDYQHVLFVAPSVSKALARLEAWLRTDPPPHLRRRDPRRPCRLRPRARRAPGRPRARRGREDRAARAGVRRVREIAGGRAGRGTVRGSGRAHRPRAALTEA